MNNCSAKCSFHWGKFMWTVHSRMPLNSNDSRLVKQPHKCWECVQVRQIQVRIVMIIIITVIALKWTKQLGGLKTWLCFNCRICPSRWSLCLLPLGCSSSANILQTKWLLSEVVSCIRLQDGNYKCIKRLKSTLKFCVVVIRGIRWLGLRCAVQIFQNFVLHWQWRCCGWESETQKW